MAKQAGTVNSVYKVVEIVGTSTQSWEDAAKNTVETAGGTLRDLRIAEVAKMDLKVKDGKVLAYLPRFFLSYSTRSEWWHSNMTESLPSLARLPLIATGSRNA